MENNTHFCDLSLLLQIQNLHLKWQERTLVCFEVLFLECKVAICTFAGAKRCQTSKCCMRVQLTKMHPQMQTLGSKDVNLKQQMGSLLGPRPRNNG
jgi:hypothetical protein